MVTEITENKNKWPDPESWELVQIPGRQHLQNVEKSQREADETLRALESELASTRLARNKLAKKAAALDEAEDTYWREFHAFKKNLNAHMEKRDAIVARTEQAQMHMERLEKTNVFNDAFHIWMKVVPPRSR